VKHLATLQFLVILYTADYRQVDGVLVFRARGQSGPENDVAAAIPSMQKGSPSVSLFCVSVPVLSEQRTSTPASSSIAERRVTIASFLASRRAPTAIVTDRTVGMATGMAATRSTKQNPAW